MRGPRTDPFLEHPRRAKTRVHRVAGVSVEFESAHAALLDLAHAAFGGLSGSTRDAGLPAWRVRLVLTEDAGPLRGREPPPPRTTSCEGVICAMVDAANYVVVHPARGAALVAMSPAMLQFPYHARYELLEFAVLELVARGRGRLSLHAACLGTRRHGLLLLGDSGAGKSTACAAALLEGLEFVAEDSVMIDPEKLTAAGVPAYLHLGREAASHLRHTPLGHVLAESPVIRRRSGARKFEMDLRARGFDLAVRPLPISAVVMLSAQPARAGRMLSPMSAAAMARRLHATQPYARGRPQWATFSEKVQRVPAFELRRGRHPRDTARTLRRLLEGGT